MNFAAIMDHINLMTAYGLIERVEDIYRYVFDCLRNVDYGKRFITKTEFIKEFNKWISTEFTNADNVFGLDTTIPDDRYVDVKLVDIPWMNKKSQTVCIYPLWLVRIHKDMPLLKNNVGGGSKKVNALCRVGLDLTRIDYDDCDTPTYTNVGVIFYGDEDLYGSSFAHVIQHEVVHFATICILHEGYGTEFPYIDSELDEFSYSEFDEFLADFIPFTLMIPDSNRDRIALSKFQHALFQKFNPTYSELYNRILLMLIERGVKRRT